MIPKQQITKYQMNAILCQNLKKQLAERKEALDCVREQICEERQGYGADIVLLNALTDCEKKLEKEIDLIKEKIKKLTGETEMIENDPVNHPSHYTSGKYETIDIIQDKLTPEQFEGFCIGNVIKYVTRYGKKNGLEDLEKALWYLNKIIEVKKNDRATD